MERAEGTDSGGSDIDIDIDENDNATIDIPRIGSFRPYVSIVPASYDSSPPSASLFASESPLSLDDDGQSAKRRKISAVSPWRTALGRGFFSLDDEGEHEFDRLPPDEAGNYLKLLRRAYRGFSDIVVGSDVQVEGSEHAGDFSVDVEPKRGTIEGDREVLYETLDSDRAPPPATFTPSKLAPGKM